MKSALICLLILIITASGCAAETNPEPIYEFADEFGAGESVEAVYENAASGSTQAWDALLDWAKEEFWKPLRSVLTMCHTVIVPLFMLILFRSCIAEGRGSGEGAIYLLRMMLILFFSELAMMALEECENCLHSVAKFASAAAPSITAVIASMGLTGTSALVSPAAALTGGIAEDLFLNCGLPLCKVALCVAIAGNLSKTVDLSRFVYILKKTANWGAGLITTIFTALTALHGGVSEVLDGVGVRTAKFAVDSAAPMIGYGASDVWESFVSGIMISKNALGMSGMAALLAAGLKPVVCCVAAILLLNIIAALLENFGEQETARAAIQIGDICQMGLSLATGALVIGIVLMGAAMSVGRGIRV